MLDHLFTMTVHFVDAAGQEDVSAYLATESSYAIRQAQEEHGQDVHVRRVEITN